MIIARYYRTDLVTGEPTIPVDYAVLPSSADLQQLHELAVEFSVYRPTAVAYRLEEGTNLRSMTPISLTHALK